MLNNQGMALVRGLFLAAGLLLAGWGFIALIALIFNAPVAEHKFFPSLSLLVITFSGGLILIGVCVSGFVQEIKDCIEAKKEP